MDFADVRPITLERFHAEWPQLKRDLEAIGLRGLEPIGSTGKKLVMGDVDVACWFSGSNEEAFKAIAQRFGKHTTRRVGGSIVSICYGADDPIYQVDVMLGNPIYLKWARFGSSQDESHHDFSPVKSVGRNVLLNVITRFISETKWPSDSPLDRVRWSIDFDAGLYEVAQTKQGKTRVLKDWKTTWRYFVSSDPNAIAKKVFGMGASAASTQTFEGVVAALSRSRWKKLAPQILQTFATEMRELVAKTPDLLGDEPENVLSYIDNVAQKV